MLLEEQGVLEGEQGVLEEEQEVLQEEQVPEEQGVLEREIKGGLRSEGARNKLQHGRCETKV